MKNMSLTKTIRRNPKTYGGREDDEDSAYKKHHRNDAYGNGDQKDHENSRYKNKAENNQYVNKASKSKYNNSKYTKATKYYKKKD
ncbi:MAG: hypothetical protein Q9M43_00265 [Sulfurimonas sp.]|nr:hypothetical protein [Sulfurimonas sp.]